MQYAGLAVLAGCLTLLVLSVTLRWGWRLNWLLGWLKGVALLALLGVSLVLAVISWELYQFQPITDGARIAVVELQRTAQQRHTVTLEAGNTSQRFEMEGDLWELQVQVLRWRGLLQAIGLDDGYRLQRLSGRYLALEQQLASGTTLAHPLHATPLWRDAWHWLDQLNLSWVYADAFTLGFMPATDGVRYAIEIGATGLSPIAMNPEALTALKGFD